MIFHDRSNESTKRKLHPQLDFNEMEEHLGKTIPRKRDRR